LKDQDYVFSQKNLGEFKGIQELPEDSYNSSVDSSPVNKRGRKIDQNTKCEKEDMDSQEAEFIGEGSLTTVYKTMKKGERSFPMAFKVFKFEDQAADSKNKFYRLISALVLQINLNLQKKDGFVKYYEVDEDNTTQDIVLLMEFISMPTLRTYLDCYGAMNLENAKFVIFNLLHLLKHLRDID